MTGSPSGAHLRLARTESALCQRGCAQQCCAQLAVPAQGRGENCKSGEVKIHLELLSHWLAGDEWCKRERRSLGQVSKR